MKDIPKTDGTHPPIILVGTKLDLRSQESESAQAFVRTEEGATYAREINAHDFVECSAKERINVDEVFYAAIKAHLNPKSNGGCCTVS